MEHSISRLADSCREKLQTLHRDLRDNENDDKSANATAVYNAIGRLVIWGSNLGAFKQAGSRSSIDWRLRKAAKMRARTQAVLSELSENAGRAHAILAGLSKNTGRGDLQELINSLDATDKEELELIRFLSVPTTELDEIIKSFQPLINRLYRLAALIKKDTFNQKTRLINPQVGDEHDPAQINFSIRLADRFPKMEEQQPQLLRRLVLGYAERRAWIHGRQRRPLIDPGDVAGSHASEHPDDQSSKLATTFYEESSSVGGLRNSAEEVMSTISHTTSFASACREGDDGELEFPDLESMEFHGKMLQYNEPFQCPFCRDLQLVETERDWRAHILMDLMPYACTFDGCSAGLFQTRHEWFGHELEMHRSIWSCSLCHLTFTGRAKLLEHYSTYHSHNMSEEKAWRISERASRPTEDCTSESCPFCDQWVVPSKDKLLSFCHHVGRHQQQLAVAAIPQDIEGLEILEDEEDSESDEFRPSIPQNYDRVLVEDPLGQFIEHRRPVDEQAGLLCPTCNQLVENSEDLRKHELRHRKPFICDVPGCARTEGFTRLNDLVRHKRRSHSVDHPRYKCNVGPCAAKYNIWPEAEDFRAHLRRIHGLEPNDLTNFVVSPVVITADELAGVGSPESGARRLRRRVGDRLDSHREGVKRDPEAGFLPSLFHPGFMSFQDPPPERTEELEEPSDGAQDD